MRQTHYDTINKNISHCEASNTLWCYQ